MERTHTPTTWHAHYEKGKGLCFPQMWNISDHNDNLLGACYQRRTARLIAAAPELLEAAKGALAALTQNKTFPADIAAAKSFLQTSIAKAEGR